MAATAERSPSAASAVEAAGPASLVLVASDAAERRQSLAEYLSSSGHNVETAGIEEADQAIALRKPDAVLVLAPLPDRRVSDLVQSMWRSGRAGTVTLISDTEDLVERVLALEMGINDLVSESCEPREILTRVNCLLRRSAPDESTTPVPTPARRRPAPAPAGALSPGSWVLNERTRELISPGGVACELTRLGVAMIDALIERPNGLMTGGCPSELLGRGYLPGNVRTTISRMRKRFADRGVEDFPIRNIYGAGYILDAEIRRVAVPG